MLAAERVRSQHAQDTGVRLPLPPVGSGPAGEPTPLRDGGIPADRESLDLSFRPGNGADRGSNSQDPAPGTSRPVVDELPQPEHTGSAVLRLTAIAELALHETRSLASRLSELEQETKALPTRRFVYGEGMIILVILAGLIAFQPELKAAIAALAGWIGSFVSGLVR